MSFTFLDHDKSNQGFYQGRGREVDYTNPTGKDGKPLDPEVRPAEWLLDTEEKEYSRRFDRLYGDCDSPPDAGEVESLLKQFLQTFTGQSLYLDFKTDSATQQQYEFSQYLLANYKLTDLLILLKTVRAKAPTSIITKEHFQQYFRQELFCKIKTELKEKYKKEEIISLHTRDFKQNLILNAVNDADLLIRLDVDSDALKALDPEIKPISESKDISLLLNAIRINCQTIFTDPLSRKHSYPDRNLSTFIKTKTGDVRHRALLGAYMFAKCTSSADYDIVYVQAKNVSARPVLLIADKKQEQYYLLDPSSDEPPRQLTLQSHWEESAKSKSIKSYYGFTENELLTLCFKAQIEQKMIDESKKMFAALKDVKMQVDTKIQPETVWQSSYFKRFACRVPEVVKSISVFSTIPAKELSSKKYILYEEKSDTIVKMATNAINNHTSRFFKATPVITEWYKKSIIAKLVHTDQTNLDTIKAMIETHQFEFSKWLPKKRCGQFLKDSQGKIINQVPQRIFDIYNVIISTKSIQDKASEIAILAAEANQHGNAGQQASTIQFYQRILDSLIKQTTHLQKLLM